jgi:hypothetical protein
MLVMHRYLTIEGSEEYEGYPEYYTEYMDHREGGQPNHPVLEHEIFRTMNRCIRNRDGKRMATNEMPSYKCFPVFDREKESKMYLTQLDTPDETQREKLKQKVKNLVQRFGPGYLTIPTPESVKSLGPSLYDDGHEIRHDYEKPRNQWTDSFTYQRFHTDAMTEREVWLPPKGYKICSSWWHFYTEPILKRVPYVICNDVMSSVRKGVTNRWTKSVKIDLKGFGLQFPREYVLDAMNVINEVYPSEEGEEYYRYAKKQFDRISIKMGEMNYLTPKRGVGLGYFSNVMTLIIAAVMQDYYIVKMFNDDILIKEEDYPRGRAELESLGFIINEKKTGKVWHNLPYFAGEGLTPRGRVQFSTTQGVRCAIFQARYHYERKQIFLSSKFSKWWLMAYHYERIFGYEIFPGESQEHPEMLGLNPEAIMRTGYVKGGLLRKYKTPRDLDENTRRIQSITYPWKDAKEKINFDKTRRKIKGLKDVVWYTGYDEYLNPRIEGRGKNKDLTRDLATGKYQLPLWADIQSIIGSNATCGRATRGRHPRLAAYHMLDNLLARDPILAWTEGGYDIVSPFNRKPALETDIHLLYESLRHTTFDNFKRAEKVSGANALEYHIEKANYQSIINQLTEQVFDFDLPENNVDFEYEASVTSDFDFAEEEYSTLLDSDEKELNEFMSFDY